MIYYICSLLLALHSLCFGEAKCKLYCMYTPDFANMYQDYFLPSIKDDFEVIVKVYPQDCPTGTYLSEGWDKTMLDKLRLLEGAILENWNDQVFIYSDIDIIFLKPILKTCLDEVEKYDFVVQQGWPIQKAICAGFLVMKGNERTLKLVQEAYSLLEAEECVDDQLALQRVLNSRKPGEIAWKLLPIDLFPNGRRLLTYKKGLYTKDSEIQIFDSMLLFHANCCVGLENKYHFLRRVQNEFSKRLNLLETNPLETNFLETSDPLDVETLPLRRTKQYPSDPYRKIIVYSPPRTGSSLVYNVVRFLFEDQDQLLRHHDTFIGSKRVLKSHKADDLNSMKESPILCLFTIRNPMDAAISHFRITPKKITNFNGFAREAIENQASRLLFAEKLIQKGYALDYLKYENYSNSLEYLFDYIEKRFSIVIDPRDKELMRRGLSKENIASCIAHLKDFDGFLPVSGFHGKHISVNGFTPPDEYISALHSFREKFKDLFARHGY